MRDLRKNLMRGILSAALFGTMIQPVNAQPAGYEHVVDMLEDCDEENNQKQFITNGLVNLSLSLLGFGGGYALKTIETAHELRQLRRWPGPFLAAVGLAGLWGAYSIDPAGVLAAYRIKPDHSYASCHGLFTAEINEHDNTITFWKKNEPSAAKLTCLLSDTVRADFLKESSQIKKHHSAAEALEDIFTSLPIQWETCTHTRKVL